MGVMSDVLRNAVFDVAGRAKGWDEKERELQKQHRDAADYQHWATSPGEHRRSATENERIADADRIRIGGQQFRDTQKALFDYQQRKK